MGGGSNIPTAFARLFRDYTDKKSLIIIGTLCTISVLIFLQGPIPQHPEYHNFADTRSLHVNIPNALNVISNVPFFFAGLYGIRVLTHHSHGAFEIPKHRAAYWVLFTSTCLVAAGSAYYHWWPTMETLFCDRLPMTIAFMSIVTILLTEKVNPQRGHRTLLPLIAIGMFSVAWWLFTELHPARVGDLRLYIIVQCSPVLLTPMIVCFYPDRYSHTFYMHITTGLYVAAKITEVLDRQIYEWTGELVSGHTLKHLIAAVGPVLLAKMLQLRAPKSDIK
jgi:hypothetical protein